MTEVFTYFLFRDVDKSIPTKSQALITIIIVTLLDKKESQTVIYLFV